MSHIRKLADLAAKIPMKPPAPSARTRGAWKEGRRALELLASSTDGCTEAMLLAEGVRHATLATLVRGGFATVHVYRARAGDELIEARRMRITDIGRLMIGRR